MVNYVVVGGGIAGVACAEELCRVANRSDSVLLLSASETIKGIKNYVKLTDVLEKFDIEEKSLDFLQSIYPGLLTVRQCIVTRIDANPQVLHLSDGTTISYDKLCISTGATPRVIADHPLVLGLRDTQSASELASRLQSSRRVLLLGNGGIALGIVHALQDATDASRHRSDGRGALQLVWAVRDEYAGSTMLDASASAFLLAASTPHQDGQGAGGVEDLPLLRSIVRAPVGSAALNGPLEAGERAHEWYRVQASESGLLVDDATTMQLMQHVQVQGEETSALGQTQAQAQGQAQGQAQAQGQRSGGTTQLAPLPPRNRAARHKRDTPAAGAGTKRGRDALEEDGGSGSVLASGTGPSDAAAHAERAAPHSVGATVGVQRLATVGLVPLGSSLGPTWMKVLQQVGVLGDSCRDTHHHPPAALAPHSLPLTDTSSASPAWPPHHSTGGTLLETGVEAVAIRGTLGTAGAVGVLADGAWHALPLSGSAGEPLPDEEGQGSQQGESWPLWVRLSNGHCYGCDLLVSATGVQPCTDLFLPGHPQGKEGAAAAAAAAGTATFARGPDGGLIVNQRMQTTGSAHIYAAGDASCVLWPRAQVLQGNTDRGYADPVADHRAALPLWFQMRLWTQARVAGSYTARCMAGALDPLDEEDGGVCWELFAHATSILGYKTVLLGAFNGQGLGLEYERALRTQVINEHGLVRSGSGASHATLLFGESSSPVQVQVRVTPGVEYAKIVLLHGRVVGALLLGEAAEDLGETLENLILNKTSVRVHRSTGEHALSTRAGDGDGQGEQASKQDEDGGQLLDLLDPNIDIEDYFD